MIFHENRLPGDGSHGISCLICYFEKQKKLKLSSAANYGWRLMVLMSSSAKIDIINLGLFVIQL